jgi:hypothetical protein
MPLPVRTLQDMSTDERQMIEEQYGARIEENEDPGRLVSIEVLVIDMTTGAVRVRQSTDFEQIVRWLPRRLIENGEAVVCGPAMLRLPAWKARREHLRRRPPSGP